MSSAQSGAWLIRARCNVVRDAANQRSDAYGGPIERRARFLLEVVDAVVSVFGAARAGVRISPHAKADGMFDSTPRDLRARRAPARVARRRLHLIEPVGTPPAEQLAAHVRRSSRAR